MKFPILILFLCTGYSGLTQKIKEEAKQSPNTFNLKITTFNHAEMIFRGISIYNISDNNIEILNIPLFSPEKKRVIFFKSLSTTADSNIKNSIRELYTLDSIYVNFCIMFTSGSEYTLKFKNDSVTKAIHLHHYYLKQIADLIDILNRNLPTEFNLDYVPKETVQDCFSDIIKTKK